MIEKKHVLSLLLAFVLVFTIVSMANNVSAAKYKTIDKSSETFKEKNVDIKTKWYAKYNGKIVKSACYFYVKSDNSNKYEKLGYMKVNLKKSSKTKLIGSISTSLPKKKKQNFSEKTRLTNKQYYFKNIRPIYKNINSV